MATRHRTTRLDLKRHIAGARAFHTGLIADTHRRLELLRKIAVHIDCLRHPRSTPDEQLVAAEESCRHLRELRSMRRAWFATYTDLANSMRRVRDHLRRSVN